MGAMSIGEKQLEDSAGSANVHHPAAVIQQGAARELANLVCQLAFAQLSRLRKKTVTMSGYTLAGSAALEASVSMAQAGWL